MKKKPPLPHQRLLVKLPAGMAETPLRLLSQEDLLWLTLRLTSAGFTLAAIAAARRKVDELNR